MSNKEQGSRHRVGAVTLDALQALEEWNLAWMKAVARVWSDPSKYEDALKEDPRSFLKRHCDYELPVNMTLEVKGSTQRDEGAPPGTADEIPMPDMHITVWLPKRPDQIEDGPVALIDYLKHRGYPCFCC
ncbi:hypothetical protein [Sorangium sp. So ce385]|uniref:hypothetical protein n=1 Tax=Sorangium sp. So ce385 TaxID=3133308 RepID=UPI003F5BFBB2